jgi:hypothetical protein
MVATMFAPSFPLSNRRIGLSEPVLCGQKASLFSAGGPGGRWPGHEIAKKRCAPFIHSFIVDEWETTNPDSPLPARQVARSSESR